MRLVDSADVLIENMRPPVKGRLGFDYETVHARNPRLIYGSLSGFGQDGPYAGRGGLDQIAQGMSGLMSVTGFPGDAPTRAGIPVADLAAGLYLAIGVLTALHDHERTGEGRWVQTSLLESMIAMMDFQAARWTIDCEVPGPAGNDHPTLIPMGCFATADGYVNIGASVGRLLRSSCETVGLPGMLTDPRFATSTGRSAHRTELNELIAARLRTRTTAAWVAVLNESGVPCGPVYQLDEGVRRSAGRAPGDDAGRSASGARASRPAPQCSTDERRPADGAVAEPGRRRAQRRGPGRAGL
jgi:formyl-CoA transferase